MYRRRWNELLNNIDAQWDWQTLWSLIVFGSIGIRVEGNQLLDHNPPGCEKRGVNLH